MGEKNSNPIVDRKRIAKNTLIQYVQVFVKMVVGLISSRLVLQALGASDYGLYNVVAGVILMFGFISSAMSITTTRFLNFEMGKQDGGDVNKVFNISNVLHICTSLLLLIILETIGIFYILNYLNVEPGKEADAMFVFQVSTIIACIGIINVPFRSLLVAHEKFSIMAGVEILSSLVNLVLIFILFYYKGNTLRLYSLIMGMTTIIFFLVYHWVGYKKWPDIIRWKFVSSFSSYKDQLKFSNWNLLGTASFLGRTQGTHILINFFFSTVINAAYAISKSVESLVNVFSFSFVKAAAPQITKCIGNGKIVDAYSLSAQISRYSVTLMQVVVFPCIVEIDYLLHLWLGPNIPEGSVAFSYLTLLLAVVSSTSCGLSAIVDGYGMLKWFKVLFGVIYFSCLVIGVLAFMIGLPAISILMINIVMDIIGRACQLLLLRKMFAFPVKEFVKSAWTRPLFQIVFLSSIMTLMLCVESKHDVHKIVNIIVMFIFSIFASYYIGMTKRERRKVVELIRMHIRI